MTTVGLLDLLRDGRLLDAKAIGDGLYLGAFDGRELTETQAAAFLRVAHGYDTEIVTRGGRTITSSVRDIDTELFARWAVSQ